MPHIDGEFTEPTNGDRASWAGTAVAAYAAETRHDPREQWIGADGPSERENTEEVMSDLLCDMHHLADQYGIDWEALLERGAMHYRDERAEEATPAAANSEEWKVRKPAKELKAGDRIVFTEAMGGEGEVVTVTAAYNMLGTVGIATEELDFDINTQAHQWITIATESEGDK